MPSDQWGGDGLLGGYDILHTFNDVVASSVDTNALLIFLASVCRILVSSINRK